MTATFYIEYYTQEDSRLVLVGAYPSASDSPAHDQPFTLPLEALSPGLWRLELPLLPPTADGPQRLSYRYEVQRLSGETLRREWGEPREILLEPSCHYDAWQALPAEPYRYTLPFDQPSEAEPLSDSTESPLLHISVLAPDYGTDYTLCLVGAHPSLGAWLPEQSLALRPIGSHRYTLSLPRYGDGTDLLAGLEYKYLLWDKKQGTYLWEEGANRSRSAFPLAPEGEVFLQDDYPRLPAPRWKRAGVAFPLFALRGTTDWGIGDFGTLLREMIPFAQKLQLQALQLLPINDTTFTRGFKDSYPYNAISVDALHPIYIDIDQLPRLQDTECEIKMRRSAELLSLRPRVEYSEVLALKEAYLQRLFLEQREALTGSEDYATFVREEASWLVPYACYSLLRDRHPGLPPNAWPAEERWTELLPQQLLQDEQDALRYHYYIWVQYELDRQLRRVNEACRERGLFLKGDLPIGVAPHGVEVWTQPYLFHTDQSAGAPPDAFASDGQNWGFPTYDWERMATDGYAWWRARLSHQARYFSALRIDHVLGFFRIWEIPRGKRSGLAGHFHPALPYGLEQWQALLGDSIDVHTLVAPPDPSLPEEEEERYPLLPDPYSEGYHPRIAFEKTSTFQSWSADLRARWRAASEDYFYVRHNALYRETGLERLGALTASTRLLLCAEDLGMIPASVPEVLDELQILSLELERMPKGFTPTGWADPLHFPSRCVATTSTHDMPSLRGWWHSLSPEEQERYQRQELGLETPVSEVEVYRLILRRHLESPALLTILPLADWMSASKILWLTRPSSEQINHPEDPDQYWCFRFPCPLPTITQLDPSWQERISTLIQQTNRSPFDHL